MQAYAGPADRNDTRPRIAIVIGGLDVSASAGADALAKLPPAVTLALAPFAARMPRPGPTKRAAPAMRFCCRCRWSRSIFPDSDPGPHVLLVGASSRENDKRLLWSLSRITGYVGITNLLGGRFLGEANTLEPMLAMLTPPRPDVLRQWRQFQLARRNRRASSCKTPLATGTLALIDDVQSKTAIDGKLADLGGRGRGPTVRPSA